MNRKEAEHEAALRFGKDTPRYRDFLAGARRANQKGDSSFGKKRWRRVHVTHDYGASTPVVRDTDLVVD